MKPMKNVKYREVEVDELMNLKADVKPMLDKIRALEKKLKLDGPAEYRGTVGYVNVTPVNRNIVDWKGVAQHFEPSYQLVNSKTSKSVSLRIEVRGYSDKRDAA